MPSSSTRVAAETAAGFSAVAAITRESQQLGAGRTRLGVVGQEGDVAQYIASDRADAMDGVATFEDEQRPRAHGQSTDAFAPASQELAYGLVVFVVRRANQRRELEVSPCGGTLQRQRDDEVGLIEVPLQLIA